MAMDQHPSRKPSPPRKPPNDRAGQGSRDSGQAGVAYGAKHEFGGYEHSSEHHHNDYGHQRSLKHSAPHKSEFDGAGGGFKKAGDAGMK